MTGHGLKGPCRVKGEGSWGERSWGEGSWSDGSGVKKVIGLRVWG